MKRFLVFAFIALFSISAQAKLDPIEQHAINLMTKGDLRSLKQGAKHVHRNHITNPAVLDVAAEVLLQLYPTAYKAQLDTLSWLARAIGQSRNGRYYTALSEVADKGTFKKLRRHARKALKQIAGPEGKQYAKGMRKIPKNRYF